MGNMTKGKSSLFKRLNFTSSDFFLYNNFITTYLRNRKNLDKLKNADAAPIQPTQHETITPVQEDDEELVNDVEKNLNVEEDEYEDIVDVTTRIMSAPSRIRSTKNFKLKTVSRNIRLSLPPRPTSQQFVLHNKPPI